MVLAVLPSLRLLLPVTTSQHTHIQNQSWILSTNLLKAGLPQGFHLQCVHDLVVTDETNLPHLAETVSLLWRLRTPLGDFLTTLFLCLLLLLVLFLIIVFFILRGTLLVFLAGFLWTA